MRVLYRIKRDSIKNVRSKIGSSIVYYSKEHKVKVGITSKPKRRAAKYTIESDYDDMIVLFKTSSEQTIRELEKFLVEKNWELVDNEIGGGGGPLGNGPYYLYIVTASKVNYTRSLSKVALIAVGGFFGLSLLFSKRS